MILWVAYRTGLRAAVGAVFPEVLPAASGGGIWTRPRVEEVAFEDIPVPMAVIQEAPPVVAVEMTGIANQAYSIEARFHYVMRRDLVTDAEEAVEAKLTVLADRLLHVALAVGQVIDVTEIDVQEGSLINAILLEKNLPYFGGTLTAMIEVGDSPA